MQLEVCVADISRQPDFDGIVNSANANLRLGSGVAGAIHRAAGPELEAWCKPHAPLGFGEALLSPGFQLPNSWVIHVRAAHFLNDDAPKEVLQRALISMLRLADQHSLRSLALPAIGTGVFKFPPRVAADLTAAALVEAPRLAPGVERVRLCVTDPDLRGVYIASCMAAGLDVGRYGA